MAEVPAYRVLWATKDGNAEEQYEDAYRVGTVPERPSVVAAAVADGASSAVFAREWANLLVDSFAGDVRTVPNMTDSATAVVVRAVGESWRAEVESKATSWYAQEKLPHGSSAALLLVEWDREAGTWTVAGIGDVCLFVVRDDKLKYAFPITKSNRFDDRPSLLSTEMKGGAAMPKVLRFGAAYAPGDRFLLMTDAIAAYFLSEWEARRKPWNDLPQSEDAFSGWLKARRDSGKLKNDDVTVLELTL